ncbi:MAG: S66 peptidase family protein [Thermodesulfobacteriota bacterium]
MILKPPRLQSGDLVGVIAPAGPVSPEDLEPGIRRLEGFGCRAVRGVHLYDSLAYTAGDDASRLEDLHAMFARPEIRAVFCARGGYGCIRLLSRIDPALFRTHPKILMGYSDITSLLWGLHASTGLVCFHGPVVRGFKDRERSADLETFFRWVQDPVRPPEIDLSPTGRAVCEGRASGPVFGGNLSLVSHLMGTPFMPDLSGAILFLEETREPLYRIDRMLAHLALGGVFDKLSGLLAGDFGENNTNDAVLGLFRERLHPLGIPLATGLPVGHYGRNIPLPIGLPAVLDTDLMRLSYLEPCVSAF